MADETHTYDSPGEYQVSIPSDASVVYVYLEGGGGASPYHASVTDDPSNGGDGGYVEGELPNVAGETITVRVGGGGEYPDSHTTFGGGGYNGGGDAIAWYSDGSIDRSGGGGGGASDIRVGGTTLSDRAVVAGGGGGGGEDGDTDHGGAGGGLQGEDGLGSRAGGGGTQDSGGSGGPMYDGPDGEDGSFGVGGNGGNGDTYGGGGGGGWYGGGGSGGSSGAASGAGGGSSYVDGLVNASTTTGGGAAGGSGSSSGDPGADGSVTIEVYSEPEAPTNLTATASSREVSLSWTANDPDANQRLYRSQSSGIDTDSATVVAEFDSSVESYTDTGLYDGVEYHYLVEAYEDIPNGETSNTSNEASDMTPLPAPTDLQVDSVDGRYATLSWSDPSNNTLAYQILAEPDETYTDPVSKLPADWWSPRASNIDMDPLGVTPFVRTEVVDEPSGEYETGVEWRDNHDSAYDPIDFTDHDKIRFYWYSEVDVYPDVWIDGDSNGYGEQVEPGTPAIVEIPRSDYNIDWSNVNRFIIRTYGGMSVGDVVYIGGVDAYTDREVEYYDDRFFIDSGSSYTAVTRELFDGQQYDATVKTWTEHTSAREDQ